MGLLFKALAPWSCCDAAGIERWTAALQSGVPVSGLVGAFLAGRSGEASRAGAVALQNLLIPCQDLHFPQPSRVSASGSSLA